MQAGVGRAALLRVSFPSAASKGIADEKLQRPASPQNRLSAQPRRWDKERLRYPDFGRLLGDLEATLWHRG
jgi:hypothetical protein